jgi:hypothetical protein
MMADDVKLDLVAKLRKQGKSEVGEYYTAYAAAQQWAYAAGFHSGRLPILLPWISMAIAWPRSTTSCMHVMRWTVSSCPRSIPKCYHSKDGETVLLADKIHLRCHSSKLDHYKLVSRNVLVIRKVHAKRYSGIRCVSNGDQ